MDIHLSPRNIFIILLSKLCPSKNRRDLMSIV